MKQKKWIKSNVEKKHFPRIIWSQFNQKPKLGLNQLFHYPEAEIISGMESQQIITELSFKLILESQFT